MPLIVDRECRGYLSYNRSSWGKLDGVLQTPTTLLIVLNKVNSVAMNSLLVLEISL